MNNSSITERAAKEGYENVAGNHYDKYNTTNPIARALVSGFLSTFDELISVSGARSVLEVGCGEGFLSMRMLSSGLAVRGVDLEPSAVEQAIRANIAARLCGEFSVADIYELAEETDASELVVCCEVLEHLPDPAAAMKVLSRLGQPWLLLSVPREPIWRALNMARGKYWTSLGNTPGHIQHWSKSSFLDLVSKYTNIEIVKSPLPWTMVLCKCD